jgi:uncharacterized protein YdhG (YjbR/CyaY superfamily)
MKNVDEYIESAPKEIQGKLKELRKIIRKVAKNAEEKISYGMPYYSYNGRLAYFAYFKDHISLFAIPPVPEMYKDELKKYLTGKSTVRFPLDQKLPVALISKLVKARVRLNEAKKLKD